MNTWEPVTEAESALSDALLAQDQERYFRILGTVDLLLPISAAAAAQQEAVGWGTWASEGRMHVLAFTSPAALRACLPEHPGSYRMMSFHRLAGTWPNLEWWLAVNPGLPIEGYLPAWFVAQINRGEIRLPGRSLGSQARMDQAANRTRAVAKVPTLAAPAVPELPATPRPELMPAAADPPANRVWAAATVPTAPAPPADPPAPSAMGSVMAAEQRLTSRPDQAPSAQNWTTVVPPPAVEPVVLPPVVEVVVPPPVVEPPVVVPAVGPVVVPAVGPSWGAQLWATAEPAVGVPAQPPVERPTELSLGARLRATTEPPLPAPAQSPVPLPVPAESPVPLPVPAESPVPLPVPAESPVPLPVPAESPVQPQSERPLAPPSLAPPSWAPPVESPASPVAPVPVVPPTSPVESAPGAEVWAMVIEPPAAPVPVVPVPVVPPMSSVESAPVAEGWAVVIETPVEPAAAAAEVAAPVPEYPASVEPVPQVPRGLEQAPPGVEQAPPGLEQMEPVPQLPLEEIDFTPTNRVEEQLLAAAQAGKADGFLSTLLLARVLLPGAANGEDPVATSDRWRLDLVDGAPHVVVFTSHELLAERLGEQAHGVWVKFTQLSHAWPGEHLAFAVNPGTPISATLPGAQVIALARWADEVGLTDERPELEPAPLERAAQRTYTPRPPGLVFMQKTVAAAQLPYYLERGYDRVTGFVHPAAEVAHLCTPLTLYAALGLGYSGSPFSPDDPEVYVLRWGSYRPSLYRVPYGGQNDAAMRAMLGWVIERPPFRGNGFAPSEGRDVIAEFKVDSTRLPHGAELWRLDTAGTETHIAVFDADTGGWQRVDDEATR